MPRKPYSITKDGRIVVHDAEALKAGMLKTLKELDAMAGEDDWEWGDPTPRPAPDETVRAEDKRAERRGRAG